MFQKCYNLVLFYLLLCVLRYNWSLYSANSSIALYCYQEI